MQLRDREEYRREQISVFFPICVKSNIPPGLAHQTKLPVPLHETVHPFQGFFNTVQTGGIGAADVTLTAVAEGAAGDHGDALFVEQALTEFMFGHTGFVDAGESIEGAFGFDTI